MPFKDFFDLNPKNGDLKSLLAFSCIVGAILVTVVALFIGGVTVEVGGVIATLVGAGITLAGKIIYDKQKENGDDSTPPANL